MPKGDKDWQSIYKDFTSNDQVKLTLEQLGFPQFESEEDIELFFSVLGSKNRNPNDLPRLAERLGFSSQKTRIVISTIKNAVDGQSWGDLERNDYDEKRRGGKLER